MKKMLSRGYFYIFAVIILSIPILFFTFKYSDTTEKLVFIINLNNSESYKIKSMEIDSISYLFLPGNVSLANVEFVTPDVILDGVKYEAGDSIESISLDDVHRVSAKNINTRFVIMQGAEIASVYMNTATGSMNEVHGDKNHKEPVSVMVYNEEGELDYQSTKGYIKGRGNTTWEGWGKRPYTLIMGEEVSVLGLTQSDRIVLLANAADITNSLNKGALDLSKELGLEWTPSSEYIDLFVNGEYMGIYLACDKIECSENKLVLDENTDYLLQTTSRIKNNETMLYTDKGQRFLVCYGDTDNGKTSELTSVLNEIEEAIGNDTIPSKLDMESFAKKYFFGTDSL